MTEKQKAVIAVLLGNFFFGTSVIAVKHIAPSLMPALALTTVRVVCTTLLFWMMFAVKPQRMEITKKDYRLLFFCAIVGITMNQTFSIRGMSLTSPIHASLLVLTTPITITLLAAWILKEKLTSFKLIGLFLGVSGGALLVFSRDLSGQAGAQQLTGDVFAILGAISYSLYVVFIRPLMPRYKAMHILQWVFLFGCIFTLPIGWASLQEIQWHSFDALSWFSLIYVVLGGTFFAYQLMNYSISKLGASITGSFVYTQPFFTAIASIILLHESLSISKVMAATLIMTGVFLANYGRRGK
jgi:drug/metabolite transporter (DMT)-like permease